jgi:hypothetical protein
MSHHTSFQPYIPRNPGDLVTAEDWNEMQQYARADLADNAAADAKNVEELNDKIANVDAPKFGGKTPDDWTDDLDQRYVRRDDPQAAGQYRRYFKQLDRQIVPSGGGTPFIEPAVIGHKLCRYPIVEVYELAQLFTTDPLGGEVTEPPFVWDQVKFLVYYASKRDPIAEILRTESSDWFYWGDHLHFWLDQFGVKPAMSQKFDDLLNDFWGKMFDPGLEQDEFKRDSFGHTPYVQRWIDEDKSVGDLVKGGQWDDLRVAVRPQLLAPGILASLALPEKNPMPAGSDDVKVYHISQNEVEIRVPHAMDLMVLLRT